MQVANAAGRLTVLTDTGGIYVFRASGLRFSRDPGAKYGRLGRLDGLHPAP